MTCASETWLKQIRRFEEDANTNCDCSLLELHFGALWRKRVVLLTTGRPVADEMMRNLRMVGYSNPLVGWCSACLCEGSNDPKLATEDRNRSQCDWKVQLPSPRAAIFCGFYLQFLRVEVPSFKSSQHVAEESLCMFT
jgi:hypothetical protein